MCCCEIYHDYTKEEITMRKDRKDPRKTPILKRITKKWAGILSVTVLALSVSGVIWYGIARANESGTGNSESSSTIRSLQNGGFENFTSDGSTNQILDENVPFWNTTAFEKKIEFVKENTNSYITNVTVKPSEGKWAAELNADEESTLYQNVNTTPSSIYEWGLDHGGRNTMDTMALVIGPKQKVDPSKPSKDGRDQLMQMVDSLKIGALDEKTEKPKKYTVYSKKFADNGTFENNAGNNAFSDTPSKIYTEKWEIWIMADGKASSGTNPWGHYGSNAEGSAGSKDDSGNTKLDTNKDYLYQVPDGQNKTLFGFVSVGVKGTTNKTLGNFLDNINFQLYHPLSGSTTTHGSAIIGASDGSTDSEGATKGHEVKVNNNVSTYVTDGEPLKIQAILKKEDADEGCSFVGVYQTRQNDKGENETTFLKVSGNVIENSDGLTDEKKKGKWIKSTNSEGDTLYTYYLDDVTSAVDLQFIFIKSPTITYDSNGGKEYEVEREYNTDEAKNVYSFKPASTSGTSDTASGLTFIPPYTSKAAEGQNDGWKFMGWLLTGNEVDNVPSDVETVDKNKLGELLLPAEHTIACNYSNSGAEGSNAAQYFKVYSGEANFSKEIVKDTNDDTKVKGVKWTKTENDDKRLYANVHNGMTMVAQWRWRQTFIPQVKSSNTYTDSANGGTIELSGISENNKNYTAQYNANGGKAYHAETNEKITVTAKPNDGFVFEGWYDGDNNLLTTNETYSYTETAESVNEYYARFSGGITQKYIRQIKDGNQWTEITNDNIATLGRYEYIDAPGKSVSSTASVGKGYKFLGWYDEDGKAVASDMLKNDGTTLQYTTTDNATYYARFAKTYTVNFKAQTKQTDGTFAEGRNGGTVSISSAEGIEGDNVNSTANANTGYKFLGWYDKDGNKLSAEKTYTVQTGTQTDGKTYYARFEISYNPQVDSKVYLSFIAESENTEIPDAFAGRDAGTRKNSTEYGLDNKYGNTIATGFKYKVDNSSDIKTIQITVEIPEGSYIKTSGSFEGNGTSILTDGSKVKDNRGSIQKINKATTVSYYWNASGMNADTKYGFIIDNLYAPGATATITVNGTEGTQVTNSNGVVNTNATEYKGKSHYSK